MRKLVVILRKLWAHNWVAILYLNFSLFPIRQAIRLPLDVYGKIRIARLCGSVIIDSPACYRGMIKIGGRGSEMFPATQCIIDIAGTIIFSGVTEIGCGTLVRVESDAVVRFGKNVRIGALCKIFCTNEIYFGDEIDFSWECQIFDTNFHYVLDINNNAVDPISNPIRIGSYNWIGNRVSVMKGVTTPNNLIVAANSVLNKDYGGLPDYSVIAGVPARLVRTNKKRLFEGVDPMPGSEGLN